MVFSVGEVKVTTKTGEVVRGTLMPFEDVQAVMEDYPVWNAVGNHIKEQGIFLFTGKTVSFIAKTEIKSVLSMRFT